MKKYNVLISCLAAVLIAFVPRLAAAQLRLNPYSYQRTADTTSYQSDTLRQLYGIDWMPCTPADAVYFTFAYKEHDHWRALDYYVWEKQLLADGTYADPALTIREGSFAFYRADGSPEMQGRYFMNQKIGWWLAYNTEQKVIDSAFYYKGVEAGRGTAYYDNGKLKELRNMDKKGSGSGTYATYYETGELMQLGKYAAGKKRDSTWVAFHPNGKPLSMLNFRDDVLESQQCFNAKGKIITCAQDRLPEFPGGMRGLIRYLTNNMEFPPNLVSTHPYAKVIVQFVVSERGKIEDIKLLKPAHTDFNSEALRIIRHMPDWEPGIQNGLPVRVYYTLPVAFKAL